MLGRLGNQFFQYAFARALQTKFYPEYNIVLNSYIFRNCNEEEIKVGCRNQLTDYNIVECGESCRKSRNLKFFHRASVKLIKLYSKFISRLDGDIVGTLLRDLGGIYERFHSDFEPPKFSSSKDIQVFGNFEHYYYFDAIRDLLLDEYTPKHELLSKNINLMNEIKNTQSVCVSIRRGDFLSDKHKDVFSVCTPEYFVEAMHRMRAQIPDCKFFIFSDDVQDVKNNFKFPYEVEYESGDDPVWEKLRLMYSCKHFIISNSTFSWWAQYLSRNDDKIVYAPTPWHWDKRDYRGLYTPCMRTIECKK